jgi:GNAT superfamily N-acetyltransferase
MCLFGTKSFRKQDITYRLLQEAVEFVRNKGAKILEGYPIDTSKSNYPAVFAGSGFYSTYEKVGFDECERRSQTRSIMRYTIKGK